VKLADLYARPELTLSVEFFPPKTDKGEETLFSEIEIIKRLNPAFCSVTYGAGGSTREKTVDLVDTIHSRCGLEVMCHLTVVGQSKDEARSILKKLKEKGIENIIALGGDPPGDVGLKPHPDGFHHAVELVREAVRLGGFSIAVAGFPEVHPRAGVGPSISDILNRRSTPARCGHYPAVFDNEEYYRYVEDVRKLGVRVPIVRGLADSFGPTSPSFHLPLLREDPGAFGT
jgi:methylenetetrahydrofolate reductase (NADPH)